MVSEGIQVLVVLLSNMAILICNKPWQIYPIGVLFGLHFDTATEVGLLVLARWSGRV